MAIARPGPVQDLPDPSDKEQWLLAGLEIMAGQQTMSGQNWVLTGEILGLPDILSGPLPTRSKKF